MKMKRLKLDSILQEILNSTNVYFRKPSKGIKYPCIIYDLSSKGAIYADNKKYIQRVRWVITVIDEDPDSEIPNKLLELQYCQFDRCYQSNGMNHFVFTLYF